MKSSFVIRAMLAGAAFALSAGAAFADEAACKRVRMSDPGWTDITATNGVAGVMLDALGYTAEVQLLSVPIGYQAMKSGDIDVFLGNWMPAQQAFIDDLTAAKAAEVLNKNLAGAKFTLAVPAYVAQKGIRDFADLAKHADDFDRKIYGIEPGAPANLNIQKMIDADDFGLKGWEVIESSEQAMLAQVERAEKSGRNIVFLAWAPHPMNTRFKIDYLAGGDKYFGANFGGAEVYTLARTGWAGACPNAAKLLGNMTFTVDMENVLMGEILGGTDAAVAAKAWLKANPGVLSGWLEGVTAFDGSPAVVKVNAALGL